MDWKPTLFSLIENPEPNGQYFADNISYDITFKYSRNPL